MYVLPTVVPLVCIFIYVCVRFDQAVVVIISVAVFTYAVLYGLRFEVFIFVRFLSKLCDFDVFGWLCCSCATHAPFIAMPEFFATYNLEAFFTCLGIQKLLRPRLKF